METKGVGVSTEAKKGWWDANKYWFVPTLFLSVVSVWAGFAFWLFDAYDSGVEGPITKSFAILGDRGTFGDMFGAVNALFTGLAFAGLICTLIVQMSELQAQREELADTREELRGQKEIMKKQSDQIDIQNFENGFFQLLKMHYEVLSSIQVGSGNKSISGEHALGFWYKNVVQVSEIRVKGTGVTIDNHRHIENIIKDVSSDFLEKNENPFSQYLTSLVSVFDFIYGFKKDDGRYSVLVLSRMTIEEKKGILVAIAYYKHARLANIFKDLPLFSSLERGVIPDSLIRMYERLG